MINTKMIIRKQKIFMQDNLIKKGNINTNSTSKIKKIIAIKKNRIVKGKRALNFGLKPHSKGLIFSNSNEYFLPKLFPSNKISEDKINEKKKNIMK